jgi:hypothetical protein
MLGHNTKRSLCTEEHFMGVIRGEINEGKAIPLKKHKIDSDVFLFWLLMQY